MYIIKTIIFLCLFFCSQFIYSNNKKEEIPSCLLLDSNICPVSIKLTGQRLGKPPLKFNYINISIKNTSEYMKWFILPSWGDDTLKKDGNFGDKGNPDYNNIEGRKYTDSLTSSNLIEIRFIADYVEDGFIAFCLPPDSKLNFENYTIESWRDIPDMEIWEVDNLIVNGKSPLKDWLPYDVFSSISDTFKLKFQPDWINLNWDYEKNSPRADLPTEKIKYIQAAGIKKFRIKIEQD